MNRLPEIVSRLSKLGDQNEYYQFYRDLLVLGYSDGDLIGDTDSRYCYPGYRIFGLFDEFGRIQLNDPNQPAMVEWMFSFPDCNNRLSIKGNLETKKVFFGRKRYSYAGYAHDKRIYQGTHCVASNSDGINIELISEKSRIKGLVRVEGELFMQDATGKATQIVRNFLFWLNENKDVRPIIKINGKDFDEIAKWIDGGSQ